MYSEFGLVVAVVLPTAAGYLWLRLWPVSLTEALRVVGGAVVGHGLVSWAVYMLNLGGARLGLGLWVGVTGVAIVLPAVLLWRRRAAASEPLVVIDTPGRFRWRWWTTGVMIVGLGLVVANLMEAGMGTALTTYPEVGIWGYKAKVFYLEGEVSREFLAAPSRSHMHPTYPLGLPLMIAGCYAWMGSVADVEIRALPVFMSVIGLVMLAGLTQRRTPWWLALAAALAWASGRNLVEVGHQLYADIWLIAAALPAVVLAAEAIELEASGARRWRLALAGVFLGCAGWIKNEGILVAVIVAGLVLLLRRRADWRPRRVAGDMAALLLPVALFAGPWQLQRQLLDLDFRDFGAGSETAESVWLRLQAVLGRVVQLVYKSPITNGVVGWLAALAILLGGRDLWLNRRRLLLLVTALGLIAAYSLAIAGSSLSVSWHLVAMPRILLLPLALLAILAADMAAAKTWLEPAPSADEDPSTSPASAAETTF